MKKVISKNYKIKRKINYCYINFFLFSCEDEINLSIFNVSNVLNKNNSKELEIYNKEFFDTSTTKKIIIIK
jgi:hypothetical protein